MVGNEEGVHIIMGPDGRETGEAFVELLTSEDLKQALAKNKCHIGRRYIDGNLPLLNSSNNVYTLLCRCLVMTSVRVSNTPGNLLEISKVSWKFYG